MRKSLVTLTLVTSILVTGVAVAQIQPPSGTPTVNQGQSGLALTKSNTDTFPATRALFIGDSSACNINVTFKGQSAGTVLTNVQSGEILPISVTALLSTSTTCTAVVGIW